MSSTQGLSDKSQAILTIISDILISVGGVATAVEVIDNSPITLIILAVLPAAGGAILRAIKEIKGSQ